MVIDKETVPNWLNIVMPDTQAFIKQMRNYAVAYNIKYKNE